MSKREGSYEFRINEVVNALVIGEYSNGKEAMNLGQMKWLMHW